jgi:DNA-binding GntR family transcriptional regulator
MSWSSGTTNQVESSQWSSAADDAYVAIKSMIIDLELQPGATIIESDLMRVLGVGRTPVREALGYLARDGLLHIYPRRAIVVAKLGVPEIQQIFEMRLVLEPSAACLAARRITPSDLAELVELTDQLRRLRDQVNAAEFLKLDLAFHHRVASVSRNTYLRTGAHHILTLNLWLWNSYFTAHGTAGTDLFTHERIVDAIARRDGTAATTAMREHILRSKEHLLAGL